MQTESSTQYSYMAQGDCTACQGSGFRYQGSVCDCVNRFCWRLVYAKYRVLARGSHLLRPIHFDSISRPKGIRNDVRRREEFQADFILVARRTLDTFEYKAFFLYYLEGVEWRECCRKLGMVPGDRSFFHITYRIQHKLGKVFREMKPFPLFPIDSYFAPCIGRQDVRPFPVPEERRNGVPLRPPLAPKPRRVPRPQPVLVTVATKPVPRPQAPAPAPTGPAAVIRDLFRQGLTVRSIARRLDGLNMEPPTGSRWDSAAVRRSLLRNPVPANRELRRAA